MKSPALLSLGAVTLALTSCGSLQNMHQPLSSDGDFDPLVAPGSGSKRRSVVAASSPNYKAGQWVETSMPNATFFRVIPKGNATADRMLAVSTPLKVISTQGTYVKVQLDSGDSGYVPEIMLAERRSPGEVPIITPSQALNAPYVPVTPPSFPEVPTIPSPPASNSLPVSPDLQTPSAPGIPELPDPGLPAAPSTVPSLPGNVD